MDRRSNQDSPGFSDDRLESMRTWLVVLARLHLDRRSDTHEASDIAQEVLIATVKYRSDIANLSSVDLERWLRKVLRNKVIDFYRKRRPEISVADLVPIAADIGGSFDMLDEMLADSAASPSQLASQQEDRLRLAAAIEELPSDYREVVLLRDIACLPLKEVAQELDCSIGVVAGRLRRARRLLYDWLENGKTHE